MTAVAFEDVHAEFLALVADMPEGYAYQRGDSGRALYVHGGEWPADPTAALVPSPLEPGCILAHWLHRFYGVPLAALVPLEGMAVPSVLLQLMTTGALPRDLLDDPTSPQLLKYLQTVQQCQDAGWAWRGAVEGAHAQVTSPPWSLLLAPTWEPAVPARVDA